MSSSDLIKDIFTNYVGHGDMSREYYLLNNRIDVNTKILNKIINKKHKERFKTLCKDYEKINLELSDESFVRGFSFAVHLLSQAYSQKL